MLLQKTSKSIFSRDLYQILEGQLTSILYKLFQKIERVKVIQLYFVSSYNLNCKNKIREIFKNIIMSISFMNIDIKIIIKPIQQSIEK